MCTKCSSAVGLALLLVVAAGLSDAEAPRGPKKAAKPKRSGQVTLKQEKETLRFLRQQCAELADVVEQLRTSSPSDYQKAIRDLSKARERLTQLRQRDAGRYELALKSWTVQSKIQLLVARLAITDDPSLGDQLRSLLDRRAELRMRTLMAERDKLRERLRKLDEQIERYDAGRAQMIEKEFASLTATSKRLKQRAGWPGKTKTKTRTKTKKKTLPVRFK